VEQHAAHRRQFEIFFFWLVSSSSSIFKSYFHWNKDKPVWPVCVLCCVHVMIVMQIWFFFFLFWYLKRKRKEKGRGYFILRVFARLSEFDACTTRNNILELWFWIYYCYTTRDCTQNHRFFSVQFFVSFFLVFFPLKC
jgi:hypothetical protein